MYPSQQCSMLFALLFAAVVGCGKSELSPLTGTVTFDGKPLSSGIIAFQNVADGPAGHASVQPDGRYVARTGNQVGLRPGEYQISIVAYEPLVPTSSGREPMPKMVTPKRFARPETSGLRYTLTESGGAFDISLSSE